MPAQKRQLETTTPPSSPPPPQPEENADDLLEGDENHNLEELDRASDSDESSYSSGEEKDEFIVVKLAEIRKEVQCPICLGIIRKTRTVMECLHRFCRACIDKSMRLGNNECPACRTHCASRRSLRDDPNYDAMISALYPDIDKYEEEELAFHEEEKARNKQIQASIAQTFRRQAEALGKKRAGKHTPGASAKNSSSRNLRGRKSHRVIEHHESDEEDGANGHNGSKDSSSDDEHFAEVKLKRYKRWGGARSSKANADGGCDDNDSESNRELLHGGVFGGLAGNREIRAWGRGGMRSNNRHGGLSWANGRISKNNRLQNLIDHLRCSNEDNEMVKISLILISLHEENIPGLKRPFLCCSSTSSVKQLCQYVAMQTSTEASGIEMVIMKDIHPINNTPVFKTGVPDLSQYELLLLDEHQTLQEIHERYIQQNLLLAYRKKAQGEEN